MGNKDSPTRVEVIGPERISSFSQGGTCVAVAPTTDGVAVWNSNDPTRGTLYLDRGQSRDLIARIKAGELDDMA